MAEPLATMRGVAFNATRDFSPTRAAIRREESLERVRNVYSVSKSNATGTRILRIPVAVIRVNECTPCNKLFRIRLCDTAESISSYSESRGNHDFAMKILLRIVRGHLSSAPYPAILVSKLLFVGRPQVGEKSRAAFEVTPCIRTRVCLRLRPVPGRWGPERKGRAGSPLY